MFSQYTDNSDRKIAPRLGTYIGYAVHRSTESYDGNRRILTIAMYARTSLAKNKYTVYSLL